MQHDKGCGSWIAISKGACNGNATPQRVPTERLKFWEKCDEMVRSGMTADVACDKIYQAYGVGTSVTKILTAMKRDTRLGSWPASLQVLNA